MFSTAYSSHTERQAYVQRAHQLRSAAVAALFRDLARWISAGPLSRRASVAFR